MTIQRPITLGQKAHEPLKDGDQISGTAVQLSKAIGNALVAAADGGLYAPGPPAIRRARLTYNGANGYTLSNAMPNGLGSLSLWQLGFNLRSSDTVSMPSATVKPNVETFTLDEGVYDVTFTTSFVFGASVAGGGLGATNSIALYEIGAPGQGWVQASMVPGVVLSWNTIKGLAINQQVHVPNVQIKGGVRYALIMCLFNAGATPTLDLCDYIRIVDADGTMRPAYSDGVAGVEFSR